MKNSKEMTREIRRALFPNVVGGSEFIEKLIVIGLFALAGLVGVVFLKDKVIAKFNEEGAAVESEIKWK